MLWAGHLNREALRGVPLGPERLGRGLDGVWVPSYGSEAESDDDSDGENMVRDEESGGSNGSGSEHESTHSNEDDIGDDGDL